MKIRFLILSALIFIGFGNALSVQAQKVVQVPKEAPLQNVAINKTPPAIMKKDCKNFLGRPMQSLCTSEAAYEACVGFLKQGLWDYCLYTGNETKRARRATFAEAKQDLLKKYCKQTASGSFKCPDTDYSITATGYLDCLAYQNGTANIKCAEPFDLMTIYADKIEANLKNKPVGYAFIITNDKGRDIERAWGVARKSPDSSPMPMTVNSKYTMASVSKNITAAAVMKLLNQKNLPVTTKVAAYLPKTWSIPTSFKDITFEELLKHRSGIRCAFGGVSYEDTQKCVENGVNYNDRITDCDKKALSVNQSIGCYNNYNYAIFRILIPRLNGFMDDTVSDPAFYYANKYSQYVNKEIFANAQFQALCKPTDGNQQPLTYKLSAPKGKGTDFGDFSLYCGSQGWFLSARTLSLYFDRLNRSEEIVSKKIADQMRENLYGYTNKEEFTTKFGKVFRWYHTGFHPASMNPGEINTIVMRFSGGVQIVFIMNSDLPAGTNYGAVLTNSMWEAMNE